MGTVAASSGRDLGLWRAALSLGDAEYAVARADEMAAVATQLVRGFVLDDASAELVRTVYRDLLSLNLGRLYELLPAEKGRARWMGIEGEPTEAGYVLTLMATAPKRGSAELGAMAGWLEMLPIEERYGTGTPYAIDQRIEIATGAVGPRDVQRFFTGLLQAMERAVDEPQPQWAVEASRAAEPRLKGTDAKLLAAIYAALPTGTSGLTDVVRVRSLGSQVPCGTGTCLAYNIDIMLDPDGVRRAGFRHLAQTIRRWDNLAKLQARLRLPGGADVAHLVVRTDPAGLRLRFVSQGGKIVPVRRGEVALDEAFSLEDVDQELDIEVRADVQYEGFGLEVRDLHFPGRLRATDKVASFSGRINQTPSLVLTGSDALRSSLATFADSTLGLGDHGRNFARYVADGRNGQGTPVQLSMERVGSDVHVLTQSTDTVLLDNALIRFAFRVVGGRLIPEQKAIDDFGSLAKQVILAIVADYEAARPRIQQAQASTP
jgi:hypothetical protein